MKGTVAGWLWRLLIGDARIVTRYEVMDAWHQAYDEGFNDGQEQDYCQERCCAATLYRSADGSWRAYD